MRSLCVLLVLGSALPASAGGFVDISGKPIDEYSFVIRGRCWATLQNTSVQDSSKNVNGTVIDLDTDLDMDDRAYIPEGELEFRYKEVAIHLNTMFLTDTSRKTLEEDEAFDGQALLAGDRFKSRFRTFQAGAAFEWIPIDLGSAKTIGLEIGFLIGARWTTYDTYIRDRLTGERFQSSSWGVLPELGLTVNLGLLNIFEIEAHVSGMWLKFNTYDESAVDTGIEARIHVDSHFYFGIGYRLVSASLERGDREDRGTLVEYLYHGPSVTLGLQF